MKYLRFILRNYFRTGPIWSHAGKVGYNGCRLLIRSVTQRQNFTMIRNRRHVDQAYDDVGREETERISVGYTVYLAPFYGRENAC